MIINLCFHGIGTAAREREPGESRYWVKDRVFLDILDAIRDASDVRISFDDGNRSDHATALPALVDRGLRATFYALAGRLDEPDSLGATELRELRGAGMEIGSHGWDHVPWRGLDEEQQRREFASARDVLAEASGGPVESAALPLGRYDRTVLRQLRRHGYQRVYTSDRFPTLQGAWLQPRYSITATDTAATVSSLLGRPRVPAATKGWLRSTIKRLR